VTDAANAVADTAANQAGAAYNAVAKAAQDGKEGVAAAAAAAGAGATADDDEEAEVEEGTSHEHFIWEVVGVCAGAVGLTAGTQYLLSDEQRAKRQARMRHMKNRTAVESLKKEKEKEKREMGARTPQGSQPYAQQLPIQMSSGVQSMQPMQMQPMPMQPMQMQPGPMQSGSSSPKYYQSGYQVVQPQPASPTGQYYYR